MKSLHHKNIIVVIDCMCDVSMMISIEGLLFSNLKAFVIVLDKKVKGMSSSVTIIYNPLMILDYAFLCSLYIICDCRNNINFIMCVATN